MNMDEIICDVPIDIALDSPSFKDQDYIKLKETITKHKSKIPDLEIKDGIVFKRTRFRNDRIDNEEHLWKIWVPESLREDLIVKFHCAETTGHPGIGKTYNRLIEKYFWPKMYADVTEFVNNCSTCKENKPTNVSQRNFMDKERLTERPFQRLYIDFMGNYPRTARGNTNLFVNCIGSF